MKKMVRFMHFGELKFDIFDEIFEFDCTVAENEIDKQAKSWADRITQQSYCWEYVQEANNNDIRKRNKNDS